MLNGDALLSFLAGAGTGSWATFCRAAEETSRSKDTYFLGRALCARGLLEFDWLGSRRWTIPRTSIIRIARDKYLAIGLLDAAIVSSLRDRGLELAAASVLINSRVHYTRWLIHTQPGKQILPYLDGDTRVVLEPSNIDAGIKLLGALPQIRSTIASRPPIPLSDVVAADQDVRYLDPETMRFVDLDSVPDREAEFQMIRVAGGYGFPRHYYVDASGARQTDLETAMLYATVRSGRRFLYHAADTLAISRAVPLPIIFERALHFLGACESREEVAVSSSSIPMRCYRPISHEIARIMAVRLLTTLEPLNGGA